MQSGRMTHTVPNCPAAVSDLDTPHIENVILLGNPARPQASGARRSECGSTLIASRSAPCSIEFALISESPEESGRIEVTIQGEGDDVRPEVYGSQLDRG